MAAACIQTCRRSAPGHPAAAGVAPPIIAIADSYDAMATDRPYHRAKDHAAILEVLHEADSGKYDPYLLNKFAGLIEGSVFSSRGSRFE